LNPQTKKLVTTIAILLLFVSSALTMLPLADAHDPAWDIPTYAYITANPSPVGVNQDVFVVMWLANVAPTAAGAGGDRFRDYMVTITRPDGSTEVQGPFTSDATSSAFFLYKPTQTGEYKFDFTFPGQVLSLYHPDTGVPGSNSPYIGDNYLPSTASTTLIVQEEPIEKIEEYPLPSSFWTRPIEGQNTQWSYVSSNWPGLFQTRRVQDDGVAPNSAHVMWTMPIELGGIVGGAGSFYAASFYSGMSYEVRFGNAIILAGTLYFKMPLNHANTAGPYVAVDLRTGEKLWERADISPTFGQLYNYESPNQHGVPGGILYETSGTTWIAYDAFTGAWLFNMTNVPSGTQAYDNHGEIARYRLVYNSTAGSGQIFKWTTAALPSSPLVLTPGTTTNAYQYRPIGKVADMSNNYEYNFTVPALPGTTNPAIVGVVPGDIILGRSSTVAITSQWRGTDDPWTMWAISDHPENRGELLWIKSYAAPPNNYSQMLAFQPIDTVNRVFTMSYFETGERLGYSLDTGELLWGPVGTPYSEESAFQYFSSRSGQVAYGNLYVAGYGGEILCYSMKNGSLLWKFSDTSSGLETPWGRYPVHLSMIADGKIFAFTGEHSPNTPLYKGARAWVVDAYTGKEVWNITAWSASGLGEGHANAYIADGFLTYINNYDNQLYCIGKGPSKLTLEAPLTAISQGQSVVLRGTITDISAGAKSKVTSGEFNIVPAVSEATMTQWMEHIYMQKPKPTAGTGVEIKLTAIDENNHSFDIGTVTSDLNGLYSIMWTPENPGKYTIIAEFAGSNSYWPSIAETAMGVTESTPAVVTPSPSETTSPTESPTQTVVPSPTPAVEPDSGFPTETVLIVVAAVVIIAVIGAAAVLLRKRA
jgi:hypothetical protein